MNLNVISALSFFVLTACAVSPKDESGTRFQVDEEVIVDTARTDKMDDVGQSGGNSDPIFTAPVDSAKTEVLTEEEKKLYGLMMGYRKQNSLPLIPLSVSLTHIAQQHCLDLQNNKPDLNGCNAHSWSDKGIWTACCYTPDHKAASCMWSKPAEMTKYTGTGYEIACGSSDPQYSSFTMTADYALHSWKESKGHNAVILNLDVWEEHPWGAIGIGIYGGFACVWFGEEADPAGTIQLK